MATLFLRVIVYQINRWIANFLSKQIVVVWSSRKEKAKVYSTKCLLWFSMLKIVADYERAQMAERLNVRKLRQFLI